MAGICYFSSAQWLRRGLALVGSVALTGAAMVHAAPPPGHPSAEQAIGMLVPAKPAPEDLNQTGKVVSTLDANEFTYVQVKRADALEWIAVPLMALKPGTVIRYEEGIVMAEFYSKLLKRTFNNIRFVGQIEADASK